MSCQINEGMACFKRQLLLEYCHAKLGTPPPAELDASESVGKDGAFLVAVGKKLSKASLAKAAEQKLLTPAGVAGAVGRAPPEALMGKEEGRSGMGRA